MDSMILYVEDDATLGTITKEELENAGFSILHCTNGSEALNLFKKSKFDLCLFDVMLPEMDGFTLAKEIRKLNKQIPILFLTAKSMKEDRLNGLTIGGDDYITKPYSMEELLLKIRIFLKRKYISNNHQFDRLQIGDFVLNQAELTLVNTQSNNTKNLTQKEADLLKELILNKGKILKRESILEKLWGKNDYFLGRSMDVFISRLRKYLNEDPKLEISNVHGVGFKLIDHSLK